MSTTQGASARGRQYATLEMKVTTREGDVYDLGCRKEGSRLSEIAQNRRIARYIRLRMKKLTDPIERAEFAAQVDKMRDTLRNRRKQIRRGDVDV